MINECIIIGGGASIKPYLSELQPILTSKFVIACNYAYKHFPHTFLTFIDRDFYKPRPEAVCPNIYEELKKEPLIVGLNINGIKEFKLDNTILLDGKYRTNLTGTLAVNLAIKIIDTGTIFLLGFDWTRQPIPKDKSKYNSKSELNIHYYDKEIIHRGIGYTGYYDKHNPDKEFIKLIKKDVKIYNVSLESNINCFEKIDYEHMFTLLNNKSYNQKELRKEITQIINV
jgi:hypothetical protein